ncbi:hypothetical protein EDF38_2142 [Frigoribacterium sp. PhB160]|uniref:hypothetical protein n=1 Tax=Frigoribacterium sp. PhB160 TaxID=2485192 RepID=UPI000F47AE0F|nr:hypothetical protein [Frigoribacterium sp. PhB160]ROS59297.1 hypothetical protein EDF38_2142 [Frigoribacterium sp. PhB160]
MDIGSWGGGAVLALVAVLWLVYLVPTWHKRQEYLATERNAVRLQQTLRVLAQTAELPEEVRVEANARSVADAQRILRDEEGKREALRRAHEAARQRALTRELAAAAPVLRAADHDPALAARRLRRSRLVATLVLALSAVALVAGLASFAALWLLAVAGLVFGAGSVVLLTQLAAVSRARARRRLQQAAAAPGEAQPLRDFSDGFDDAAAQAQPATSREWTPVPVPRPLYLRRGRQRLAAVPPVGAQARLDAAAAAAAAPPPAAGAVAAGAGAGSTVTASRADAPVTGLAAARRRSAAAAAASSAAASSAATTPAAVLRAESERSVQALRESQRAQHDALREAARAEAALSASRAPRPAARVTAEAPRGEATASGAEARQATRTAPPAPAAPPSRFARMGIIDDLGESSFRLDEALERRRAV